MGRGRRHSSKLEDRTLMGGGRQAKSGRRAIKAVAAAALLATAAANRKDRSFDRGAIPTLALPNCGLGGGAVPTVSTSDRNAALASAKDAQARPPLAPPETPDADEDEGGAPARELPSRESIKTSSRSKLAQRARSDKSERVLHHAGSTSHAHHVALDIEADGSN